MNVAMQGGLINGEGLTRLEQFMQVALFQSGYNTAVVLAGTTSLGTAAGLVGAFSVLRKRALIGDALAHSALPGIAAAFLISVYWRGAPRELLVLLLGATISGVLGVVCVQGLVRFTRLTEETAIGAVLSVFFGFGIVLLSIIQNLDSGSAGGLSHFIYGQTAAMNQFDAWLTFSLAVGSAISVLLFFKEFQLICFDQDFALSQGWPVSGIDFFMMALVVVVTVVGLQSVGMLLIVAMLIIPAAAARFWTEKLKTMVLLSALFGGLSGYVGAAASSVFSNLPAGGIIVLSSGVVFAVSFFLAPQRGVVATAVRVMRLHLRIAEDHFLRMIYEAVERRGTAETPVEFAMLPVVRAWRPWYRGMVLLRLWWQKAVDSMPWSSSVLLTESGRERAARLTRNHRLWEEYLLQYGNVDVSHVDYSADLAEHVLSPEIVAGLERSLSARGNAVSGELASVHPTGAEE